MVARHAYAPFGEELTSATPERNSQWGPGNDNIAQKFTGKERDAESGLDYFGARYYGSSLSRFTSPDVPLNDQYAQDPQSWNLYSYVRNNPLSNIDPNGEDCITTSNQSSSGITVTTEQGGSAETCSGTYVNGTVDRSSYSYNGRNLGYSFSNDTASGTGTISFGSSQSDNSDWGPGSSNMLGAAQIGRTATVGNGLGIGLGVIGAGAGAGIAYGAYAGGTGLIGLGIGAGPALKKLPDLANLSDKILRQMVDRGWTKQDIWDTIQNGKAYDAVNKATGGPATEYVNPSTGKFVVVDEATRQVLQVSRGGFSPNHLIQ